MIITLVFVIGSFLLNFLKHIEYSELKFWSIFEVVNVGNIAGTILPEPTLTNDVSTLIVLLNISALRPLLDGCNIYLSLY